MSIPTKVRSPEHQYERLLQEENFEDNPEDVVTRRSPWKRRFYKYSNSAACVIILCLLLLVVYLLVNRPQYIPITQAPGQHGQDPHGGAQGQGQAVQGHGDDDDIINGLDFAVEDDYEDDDYDPDEENFVLDKDGDELVEVSSEEYDDNSLDTEGKDSSEELEGYDSSSTLSTTIPWREMFDIENSEEQLNDDAEYDDDETYHDENDADSSKEELNDDDENEDENDNDDEDDAENSKEGINVNPDDDDHDDVSDLEVEEADERKHDYDSSSESKEDSKHTQSIGVLKPQIKEKLGDVEQHIKDTESSDREKNLQVVKNLPWLDRLLKNGFDGSTTISTEEYETEEEAEIEDKEQEETMAPPPTEKPNIIVIMASDLGWRDVGFHGSEIRTPELDALVKEGVRLDNHYVQDTSTGSRSQLMTGKYQIRTGLQHGHVNPSIPTGIPADIPTLPEKLRELGYSTNLVGKWNLGHVERAYLPTHRGFDYFYGFLGGAEGYYSHDYCGPAFNGYCGHDLWHNEQRVNDSSTYSTHMYADRARDVIEGHAMKDSETPLFLMVSFQAVATPNEVPDKYVKAYDNLPNHNRRDHAGMVSCLDEAVGNIRSSLEKHGLWDNSMLVFLTDNGGSLHHGSFNYPLRGGKGDLWEGGIKGVAFTAGPLIQNPGLISREFIHVSDWFPTLLWLAGGRPDKDLDGLNIWDAISGRGPSPRKELLHNIDPLYTPRKGTVKEEHLGLFDTTMRAAYRYKDWKILTGCPYAEGQAPRDLTYNIWLYNIETDPEEMINQAFGNPTIVSALLMRMSYFLRTSRPPWFPLPDLRAHPARNGGVIGPWTGT